jgi:predicted phosphodiesterase
MPSGKPRQFPSHQELAAIINREGSISAAARALGIPDPTLRGHVSRTPELQELVDTGPEPVVYADDVAERAHGLLRKGKVLRVEDLADALDCSPKRARAALDELRQRGFRVPDEVDGRIELQKVPPARENLHRSLLEGKELRIGLVSDTHLSSNEEALSELHLAYDTFMDEGITEVLHAGDWTCGAGIFPTQKSEIKHHTFEAQVDYLVENYPQRPGIVTRGISGNHDIEGDFGRIGANPVVALANRRDDVEFLGDYSAHVELPGGAWIHLLHGKGGMSYAYSYKAQKLVDGYPAGRKPSILAVGHWHVSGHIEARGVEVVWPMCFEWRSKFLERLGLHPAVGFQILNLTIGDDGSLVRFTRERFRFWEGRVHTG